MTVKIHPSVQALEDEIIETRRDIHKHPELSFQEFRTAQLVSDRLQSLGISVQEKVGKTGVVGTLKGGKPVQPSHFELIWMHCRCKRPLTSCADPRWSHARLGTMDIPRCF